MLLGRPSDQEPPLMRAEVADIGKDEARQARRLLADAVALGHGRRRSFAALPASAR
ncbi:hypothetical protein SCOCK_30268 [Actinacidiphila cocklensis]|uniref:Uncharacterized protein n=1 Tax=Actinacidiphila cocklensis TaxID=887465 RepID=A0A9W4DT11_9ACTN|nr:hypothetical protein SCOCK_30268 [Actinacidiphila cocklensis]